MGQGLAQGTPGQWCFSWRWLSTDPAKHRDEADLARASWLSLTFDTGGEFPKRAESEPVSWVTMADFSAKSLVSRPFGPSGGLVVATSAHPNTSPPVSLLVSAAAMAPLDGYCRPPRVGKSPGNHPRTGYERAGIA
jgi:hypothetical protein